jgi:hypothetical protein
MYAQPARVIDGKLSPYLQKKWWSRHRQSEARMPMRAASRRKWQRGVRMGSAAAQEEKILKAILTHKNHEAGFHKNEGADTTEDENTHWATIALIRLTTGSRSSADLWVP